MKIDMRPRNFQFFFVGSGLFLLFLVLLLLEARQLFLNLDPQATRALQSLVPRVLDVPLSVFTLLGSAEVMSLTVLFMGWYLFRKLGIIPVSLALFGVIFVFELIGKFFVYHPGPPTFFFRYAIPFGLPHYVRTNYSFPSGHVGRTVFVVVILTLLVRRFVSGRAKRGWLYASLLVFGLLMMVSRVYLGEHWTSDVVGGGLLGSAMGFLAMVYY